MNNQNRRKLTPHLSCVPSRCFHANTQLQLRLSCARAMSWTQTRTDRLKDCCALVVWTPIMFFVEPWIRRKRRKKNEQRASGQRPKGLPPPPEPQLRPLPLERARRLSDVEGSHAQLQSALIARIPIEIRLLIWEHLLGRETEDDVLHLDLVDGSLGHVRCYESKPCYKLGHDHHCWGAFSNHNWRVDSESGKAGRQLQSILLTCRLL